MEEPVLIKLMIVEVSTQLHDHVNSREQKEHI